MYINNKKWSVIWKNIIIQKKDNYDIFLQISYACEKQLNVIFRYIECTRDDAINGLLKAQTLIG